MERTKLYWILGFVGVLLSMTGDLLLGAHVHPDAPDAYTRLMLGCSQVPHHFIALGLFVGAIGIPMQYFGYESVLSIVRSRGCCATLCRLIHWGNVAIAFWGASVHILCSLLMLMMKLYPISPEMLVGTDMSDMLASLPPALVDFTLYYLMPITAVMLLLYYVMAVSLFIAIVSGKTQLPRWACLFNPMLVEVLINFMPNVNNAFVNGMLMSNMALGGLVTFTGILLTYRYACRGNKSINR
ncbi:MAG: hypothetical protein J6L03_06360 [Bacteroidaceae bacterium]|nr:hypothetical protein [Bacteroidaceae bacterium]